MTASSLTRWSEIWKIQDDLMSDKENLRRGMFECMAQNTQGERKFGSQVNIHSRVLTREEALIEQRDRSTHSVNVEQPFPSHHNACSVYKVSTVKGRRTLQHGLPLSKTIHVATTTLPAHNSRGQYGFLNMESSRHLVAV